VHNARTVGTSAQPELERIVAIARAVELLALVIGGCGFVQPAGVMHANGLPAPGLRAGALLGVVFLEFGDPRIGHWTLPFVAGLATAAHHGRGAERDEDDD
jgi:hypothetical protein